MTVLATLRMTCFQPVAVRALQLKGPSGVVELPVDGQDVRVPYPLVRAAVAAGWAHCDPSEVWPPKKGSMSPPEPLAPGDTVALPDGTNLTVAAPFNQVMEIPERFIGHFESKGWHRLAQYA